MKKSALMLGAVLLSVAAQAAPATAATYLLNYTRTSGSTTIPFASLTLTTEDTLNSVGGYNVTAVSGDVSGDTITGLIANPNQPNPATSTDTRWKYDNVFFPTSNPVLDIWGLYFASATMQYNLYGNSANSYTIGEVKDGNYVVADQKFSTGTMTVNSVVPEPQSWLMMLGGFMMLGAVTRYKRKSARPATLAA